MARTDEILDIKADNIFVKFRDISLIESGYFNEVPIPDQDRSEKKYSPIPSQPLRFHYFGREDDSRAAEFDIVLGDWGVASWTTKHLTENIQPVLLRAPEVLIKAPWDKAVDWWNLGALLLELYRAVRMFDGRVPPDGHYEVKQHVAEIVDMFGPFPEELLAKGKQDLVRGIFYDEDGKFREFDPRDRPVLASEEFMPGLKREDREEFASFLRLMMTVDPAKRPEPEDLLRHPWLAAMR